jgi:integrase
VQPSTRKRVTLELHATLTGEHASAGNASYVVQRMLGHASAAMTLDLYGHLLDDDLLGVAEALGKAIDSVAVSLRYPENRI